MEYLSLQPFENRKTNNGLKKLIDMRFKHHLLSLGCAALMLASCTDDALDNGASNGLGPEADSNVVTLTVLDGASQQGRIHTPSAPDTRALKSQRLQYVATIGNPDWQDEGHVWSATSVYIDDAKQQAYITWHSDRQAQNQAQTWGGAMDVINIANEDKPEVINSLGNSNLLKFNNIIKHDSKLYLSAMHPRKGGVVARVDLTTPTQAELIGFPGSSVNAIALCNEKLMVVSGFKGTYGTVSPEQPAIDYDYEQPGKNTYVTLNQSLDKDFGGKYVAVENGDAYILRQNGENNGQIIDVNNKKTIDMSVSLLSEEKFAEDYDPETGEWKEEGTSRSEYFGKHVMVIRKGYAYVAAGKSGIYKYDLTSGEETKINGIFATGLYADDEFLYAATGSGLRIYQFNDETGDLPLYAFEVETYDEKGTGAPTSTTAATTGANTTKRHSPNFVAAHYNEAKKSTYIYIAYGQSGVRVYKFVKEGEEQPEEPGDEHPWVDPDPESPIVWAEEDVEGYYAWGEIFHAASGENNYCEFEADPQGLSFTSPDGITMTNAAGYWAKENNTQKTVYSWENYRFFDGTNVLTQYTLNKDCSSKDGLLSLKPEDDVATMRWGDGWRMPTQKEWEALLDQNNIKNLTIITEGEDTGTMTITFNNDVTITFPPTGYYSHNSTWKPGDLENGYQYYWANTLSQKPHGTGDVRNYPGTGSVISAGWQTDATWCKEGMAYMADFGYLFEKFGYWEDGSSMWAENDYDRCFGFKVRPVKDKKNMPDDFPDWQNK